MNLNFDKSKWRTIHFGDVVNHVNETVRDAGGAGIDRVIGLEHLDPGELEVTRWSDDLSNTTFTKRVRPGQTLFGKRRAYQRKAAYAEFDAITSGDILTLEAIPDRLLTELLPFLVHSEPFFANALKTSAGSLSPRTNWGDLAKFEFALPPLPEQRRLADLLWAAEHHRRELAVLATQAATVEGRTYQVSTKRLGTVADFVVGAKAGGTPSRKRSDFFGGDIPWLKSGEVVGDWITATEETITESGLSNSSATWVEPGSVLVAMYGDGGTRGQVARAGMRMTTNQAVLALSPDTSKVDPDFFYFWLQTRQESLRLRSAGAAQKNLSKGLVLEEEFPVVPLDEQSSIVEAVKSIRRATASIRDEADHVAEMMRSTVEEVFG